MAVTADARRMQQNRAIARDLRIPMEPLDAGRRELCEADDERWLRTYCADVFYNPFTKHQKKVIQDCHESLKFGTLKCKAAPRGDGKSSIVKYLAKKYAICREVRFPLILAATSSKAKKTLGSLKRRLASGATFNQQKKTFRLNSPLGEDYPLECCTAAYVDPWPSRARNVTANNGHHIHVEWGADWFIIPTWEDKEPLGPILLALGITSDDLQGCNIYDQRPDFVMLDDLDSRDSLAAEDGVVAGKIEEAIDKTVAGLGGQSRRLGQFMLCTITSRESAAFKYSDPKQKPAWSGERIPAIVQWPDECTAAEGSVQLGPLAQTYVELRQHGQATLDDDGKPADVFGRKAHEFYLKHQEEIEAGAVLSNPHNFERDLLPDGSQKQVSSYQRCLDYIADSGMLSFLTEHQNDPPDTTDIIGSNISPRLIQKQVNGRPRGVIPDGCTVLTHTCDVGKLKGFHWIVRAWEPNGTSHVIDYGIMSVQGAKFGSDEGLERAIFNGVLRRVDEFKSAGYAFANGDTIRESISTFDARWQTDAVLSGVAKAGMGVRGIIGIGRSAGCVQGVFRDVTHNTQQRRQCGTTGAYEELHVGPYGKLWVIHASADKWKGFEHDRWLTARDKPGCAFLFGEPSDSPDTFSTDERSHEEFAKQICAEIEIEEEHKRKWVAKGKENDYLDTAWHSCCAAAVKGIRVLAVAPVVVRHPEPPPSGRIRELRIRQR
jgi:hypothetical protein